MIRRNYNSNILAGQGVCVGSLYNQYRTSVYNYAVRILHNDIAEDICQEVFVSLLMKGDLSDIKDMKGYIFRATKNKIVDYLRNANRQKEYNIYSEMLGLKNESDAETALLYKELYNTYTVAIGKLSPRRREVYKLSKQEGLRANEISELLGVSLHTVKETLRMANEEIRNYMCSSLGYGSRKKMASIRKVLVDSLMIKAA